MNTTYLVTLHYFMHVIWPEFLRPEFYRYICIYQIVYISNLNQHHWRFVRLIWWAYMAKAVVHRGPLKVPNVISCEIGLWVFPTCWAFLSRVRWVYSCLHIHGGRLWIMDADQGLLKVQRQCMSVRLCVCGLVAGDISHKTGHTTRTHTISSNLKN